MTAAAGRRGHGLPGAVLTALLALAGCAHRKPPPPPPPLRYVLEPAWQSGSVWFYPHETFNFDETGIASVLAADHPRLTADNESYDPDAMAAAMQAVQLPAIAVVTDLDNGREVMVRVNDRGPADPGRLIAVTPRVAALLGMNGPARVRVRFDPAMSMALSHQVQGHAADLPIETAPRGAVQQSDLAPLAGTSTEAGRNVASPVAVAAGPEVAAAVVPLRLPERVTQGYADPGVLMIDGGTFTHADSARRRWAVMSDIGARIVRSRSGGQTSYAIEAGPYEDVASADAALVRALADGVSDARIVVESR